MTHLFIRVSLKGEMGLEIPLQACLRQGQRKYSQCVGPLVVLASTNLFRRISDNKAASIARLL